METQNTLEIDERVSTNNFTGTLNLVNEANSNGKLGKNSDMQQFSNKKR